MLETQVTNYRHGNSGHRATDPVSDLNCLPTPSAHVYAQIMEALHNRAKWMDSGNTDEDRKRVMTAECGAYESVALWLLQAYGQDTRMLERDREPGAIIRYRNL